MIVAATTKLAGVLAWPVSHSLSPRVHGYWLEANGIDGLYLPLAVRPEHFATAVRMLAAVGFRGFNVTLPHKEAALAVVDEVSALARRIGAVNTVIVRADGSLLGENSDAFGFTENLKAAAPGLRVEDGPAVVLGAGGAGMFCALTAAGRGSVGNLLYWWHLTTSPHARRMAPIGAVPQVWAARATS